MTDLPKPRKQPGQARSQRTVAHILEVAARVLGERGYAGTNTNLIAERAGVSVGSLYQYFPNKDALVVALHERHGQQMAAMVAAVLSSRGEDSVAALVQALVRGLLAAHRLEPALHRVLEQEFPFYDAPRSESEADQGIAGWVRALLRRHAREQNSGKAGEKDLELQTWVVLRLMEALVHQAVLDPPPGVPPERVEAEIVAVVLAYLSSDCGT